MVKDVIIRKNPGPSEWVSKKNNGKIRIWLESKDLNKTIKRWNYRIHTFEVNHKLTDEWVSSVAHRQKNNGKVRTFLESKDVDKTIKRCHNSVTIGEEITHVSLVEWVSSPGYREKNNGKLRISLDSKDINKTIKWCNYKSQHLARSNPQGKRRKLRICIDPKDQNKAIKWCDHRVATLE